MKKKYISPMTVIIPEGEIPTLLAESQSPFGDSKQSDFSFEEDSNPWDSGKDSDFDPWN